jgi:hypothetical protein
MTLASRARALGTRGELASAEALILQHRGRISSPYEVFLNSAPAAPRNRSLPADLVKR